MSLHAPLQLVPCHVGTELLDPAGEVHRASAALSNAHAAASPCPAEDGHVAVGRAVDVQVVQGPVGPLRGVSGVSGLDGSAWGVFPWCCAGQAGRWRGGSNLVEAAGLGRALPSPLGLADAVEGGGLVQAAAVRRDALDALGSRADAEVLELVAFLAEVVLGAELHAEAHVDRHAGGGAHRLANQAHLGHVDLAVVLVDREVEEPASRRDADLRLAARAEVALEGEADHGEAVADGLLEVGLYGGEGSGEVEIGDVLLL